MRSGKRFGSACLLLVAAVALLALAIWVTGENAKTRRSYYPIDGVCDEC
jgi:hypothetical protein